MRSASTLSQRQYLRDRSLDSDPLISYFEVPCEHSWKLDANMTFPWRQDPKTDDLIRSFALASGPWDLT